MPQKSSKDSFNRITNPDGTPVRDKDNDAPQAKPDLTYNRPPPNLAPTGTMGIRQSRKAWPITPSNDADNKRNPLVPGSGGSGIAIEGGKLPSNLWIKGEILTMPGYSFYAKTYNEPSKFGIDGGKISKLDVYKDEQLVLRFDRGWDQAPRNAEHVEAVQRIRNGLGDAPEKSITAPDRNNNQSRDLTR